MTTDELRAEFEAWWLREVGPLNFNFGWSNAWLAWQAAYAERIVDKGVVPVAVTDGASTSIGKQTLASHAMESLATTAEPVAQGEQMFRYVLAAAPSPGESA